MGRTQREAKHGTIEVRIRNVQQLFNSLDPSPFIDKDLDAEAEQFIEGWAAEMPRDQPLRLVLHVETPVGDDATRSSTAEAIRNFFKYREQAARRDFRRLWAVGRLSLLIGLLFVASCIAIAHTIAPLWQGAVAEIVKQSLVIVGWVAMWRPLEIFLYDWWPIAQRVRLCRRLSQVSVEFASPTS